MARSLADAMLGRISDELSRLKVSLFIDKPVPTLIQPDVEDDAVGSDGIVMVLSLAPVTCPKESDVI